MEMLWSSLIQFLVPEEQGEVGDVDGVLGEARGGLQRWRSWWPGDGRVSIWVKLEQGRKNPMLGLVMEPLYGARGASSRRQSLRARQREKKLATASRWPPYAGKR
jgi:hypothetical protein